MGDRKSWSTSPITLCRKRIVREAEVRYEDLHASFPESFPPAAPSRVEVVPVANVNAERAKVRQDL